MQARATSVFSEGDNKAIEYGIMHYRKGLAALKATGDTYPKFMDVVKTLKELKQGLFSIENQSKLDEGEIERLMTSRNNYKKLLDSKNKPILFFFKRNVSAEAVSAADKVIDANRAIAVELQCINFLFEEFTKRLAEDAELKKLVQELPFDLDYHATSSVFSGTKESYKITFRRDQHVVEFSDLNERTLKAAQRNYERKLAEVMHANLLKPR